jgi:hypothetical protein
MDHGEKKCCLRETRQRVQGKLESAMYKYIIPQSEPTENSGVGLTLLLDTIDATQDLWESLLSPYNLFLLEARKAVAESLGVCRDGN